MKHTRWLFLLLVLALPAVSCNTPEPEPEKVTVSVNPASLDFEQGGGTASLTVTSNGLWYARSEGSWISLSPSSGSGNATVQVTAAPNSGDARTAGIVVETSDQKATVTVSQNAYVAPQPRQKTLREIRALYPGKDYTITDDFFVEGLVISDYRRDTDGGLNNYTSAKTIIISDGDAGLMLYCKADNKTFARGQRVRVDLRNQVLSVYADGAIQVSGLPLENITYLGTEKPQAKEITVEQLLSGQYECTYVAVKEVQVRQEFVGKAFYTAADKGSVGFEGRSGGQFDLFTSQYAVFGADIVPSGSGTLKGIAGKYSGRIQVTISEKADYAGLTGARYDTGSYFTLRQTEASVSGDAGSFSILLLANVPWKASSSDAAFSVTPSSGQTGGTVTISYDENPSTSSSRSAVITFTTEAADVAARELRLTITQQPLEAIVESTVQPWLELPAVKKEEGKGFFSHDMVYENEAVRNYSFWFDLENRVSLWVAYPLYKGLTSGTSRTDKWDFDPIVPRRFQGDATRSYTGYDRGHQLPSADRLCNAAANEQTFYFTNITPQNANLNQGIWETLESQVRGQISSCDTLYVVTGCVLTTGSDDTLQYVSDTQGRNVAVPKAYYKVVLKYKAGAANGGYSAIGFWLENKSYGSQVIGRTHALSVAEIESRTGFDFFHNLPDTYEKEAESKFDASAWGL
ncbi:MAG: DNA/RNA non-specific endonuclease [Bacteroidales bacterium]|nr:DNA/RNA non-specific endonuclease [Bacteroidales bacterium]